MPQREEQDVAARLAKIGALLEQLTASAPSVGAQEPNRLRQALQRLVDEQSIGAAEASLLTAIAAFTEAAESRSSVESVEVV
jgi:hypothetical protein